MVYNQCCPQIFGHSLKTFDTSCAAWENLIHPVDRERVVRALYAPFEPVQLINWHTHETVLVVDDEPNIRLIVSRMVESFGFSAVTACDGLEGVEKIQEHAGLVTLVLLDLTIASVPSQPAARGGFARICKLDLFLKRLRRRSAWARSPV